MQKFLILKDSKVFDGIYPNPNVPITNLSNRVFFYWDSLHPRLNSHYETWSYKQKKHNKITAYRKSV